ncbi:MAG TPA: cysteine desulfurase family protein, partial [Acidobacteriaceae bacterium]|nr:cysteine desulfurase family protein [Acidobacteriaceae bacterium]
MRRVYMDANATTPLLPEVLETMRPFFIERFGNASSIHGPGQQARAAVERARDSVAALLHCRPSEIVFTSGGTESDNMALFGTLSPGDHLITSSIEHHAVLHAAERLAERGVSVTFLPVSGTGAVCAEDVRAALRPQTRLVSIMLANNETGVIQPVAEISRIVSEANVGREREILLHTDAVQAASKLSLDVRSLGCHLLTLTGHKIYAPLGIGVLYVRRGLQIEPLLFGGTHERQRRAGTENLPGIVGLGKAAEIARNALTDGTVEKITALRNRFEQGILAQVEDSGVNSGSVARVPNTTNIYFDNLEGEALVIALDLKGL